MDLNVFVALDVGVELQSFGRSSRFVQGAGATTEQALAALTLNAEKLARDLATSDAAGLVLGHPGTAHLACRGAFWRANYAVFPVRLASGPLDDGSLGWIAYGPLTQRLLRTECQQHLMWEQ
ncbi:hypothetical protein HET69_15405 [Streptomyces sp. CJ_13]|uniref:hypothetical protein n=1 Tax=Streptomyces sp. CJ_13 TaxID=2724943 RepID=UPI001BDC6DB5|nr:hypothetical protein [Streptomyces sp. CJ_13]MBT1185357.1 hypothetical protein [Streptomyces sp. CJ_13]